MSSRINIEQIEEHLKQAGLDNGELENLLNPIKELNNQRRYGLVWEEPDNTTYGSDSAEQELLKNFPFLKEVNEHRIFNGEQHPDHLLIEGDNLHALKTMQYTHKNKIDVIYIDPPYNTGNTDFVYNDKYVDNEDSWRHSKWLSFMNKRLRLARELMTDEGVIFISIDDNELYQLKLLCDQIFGEDNFVANLPRITKKQRGGQTDFLEVAHDYVLIYSFGDGFDKVIERDYGNSKIEEDRNGKYIKGDTKAILASLTQGYSKGGDYDVEYEGKIYSPITSSGVRHRWLWSKDRMEVAKELGILVPTKNGLRMQLYIDKQFDVQTNTLIDKDNKLNLHSKDLMEDNDVVNSKGSNLLKSLGMENTFDYSKPTKLIKILTKLHPNKNATVLDFFAGSGTTAHAVMELNKEDGGNRQAIVITNNEINSSEEEDLLVEKGYVEPITGTRRGTKKHSEWLEKVNEFKQTPEYLEFIETDEYKDLGIARAVTEQRINKVINGYTTPKNKEVEGLDNNNFYHFEVVLEPDLMDMDLNTYVLVKKTKDIIRIKEGVYTTEEDISTETTPAVKLVNEDKEVIVVLSVRVTDADIHELVQNFNDEDKQHVIYTSYTGFEYGINNIRFEELPKELLQAIKHDENK